MKIGKGIKVIVAGTVTWVAAVGSYNAIFSWAEWPWSYDAEGEVALLWTLPPMVAIVGFVLFRWAFGEAFVTWLVKSKPTIGSVLFFSLVSVAAINASTAASNSEEAYYMADEASSSASDAAAGASEAAGEAREAAAEASSAKTACLYR